MSRAKADNQSKSDACIPLAAVTRFPSPIRHRRHFPSKEARITFIAERFREILEVLGCDLEDESLSETPERVAEMYVNELFAGLDFENFPDITTFEQPGADQEPGIVVVRDISVATLCEHHLLPITGSATVAYRPNGRIIGLSKIHRVVRYFCQRPQLQERLTVQIADSLQLLLQTEDVAVRVHAHHGCVSARGVRDEASTTETAVRKGIFTETIPNQIWK